MNVKEKNDFMEKDSTFLKPDEFAEWLILHQKANFSKNNVGKNIQARNVNSSDVLSSAFEAKGFIEKSFTSKQKIELKRDEFYILDMDYFRVVILGL